MNTKSLIRLTGIVLVAFAFAVACTTATTDNSLALHDGVQRLFANTLDDQQYRIAVLPLVDYRTGETDELGGYISSDVMYQISVDHAERVQMVEREMITQLLAELEFDTMSGMISEGDVKQFGEMSGADFLIMGTKLELTDGIEANLRLVEVESAEIKGVSKINLGIDERYAALMTGAAIAAGETPTDPTAGDDLPVASPGDDNPWTEGQDLSGTTILALGAFIDRDAELFEESMRRFEEETGITVEYAASDHFEEELFDRVDAGTPPDVIIAPQPGIVAALHNEYDVVHDVRSWLGDDHLGEQYDEMWRELATVDGVEAGVWYRAMVKSIVWYNRPVFEREQYEIPDTWSELVSLCDQIVADGYVPWSVGIESGGATGWVATDWIEDIMLRIHPPAVYDHWVAGDLAFDSPEVREAFGYLDEMWFEPGYVLGGRRRIVETWFGDAIHPLAESPPQALMHRQGQFIVNFMPENEEAFGSEIGFFYLPPIERASGRPVLGAGDIVVPLGDTPEIRAFIRYVSHGASTRRWVEEGGFISPHNDTPLSWYRSEVDRGIASLLRDATVFRFDASDLMPPEVGSGRFWSAMEEYIDDENANLRGILRSIDAAYP